MPLPGARRPMSRVTLLEVFDDGTARRNLLSLQASDEEGVETRVVSMHGEELSLQLATIRPSVDEFTLHLDHEEVGLLSCHLSDSTPRYHTTDVRVLWGSLDVALMANITSSNPQLAQVIATPRGLPSGLGKRRDQHHRRPFAATALPGRLVQSGVHQLDCSCTSSLRQRKRTDLRSSRRESVDRLSRSCGWNSVARDVRRDHRRIRCRLPGHDSASQTVSPLPLASPPRVAKIPRCCRSL